MPFLYTLLVIWIFILLTDTHVLFRWTRIRTNKMQIIMCIGMYCSSYYL